MARKKLKFLYVLFEVAVVAILLELAALPVLSKVTGRDVTREELEESLRVTGEPVASNLERENKPEWMLGHVLHPFLGFVRNHDAGEHIFNGRSVTQPVNRFGFFGKSIPEDDTDDRVVVALTGGSAALDLYLRSGSLLRDGIASAPRFAGKQVEVVSVALGGMKQPQQLLALSYFLSLGRRPDLLINLDGFNEIALPLAENTPFGVAPYFPRSWRTYASTGFDAGSSAQISRMQARRKRVADWRRVLAGSPLRKSTTVLAIWKGWSDRQYAAIARMEEEVRGELRRKDDLNFQITGPPGAPERPSEVLRVSVDVWAESSRQLAALCVRNDIEYFHFLQPNQHLAGSKTLTPWERRHAVAAPSFPHVQAVVEGYPMMQAAGAALQSEGIPFHDLTAIFKNEHGDIYADACCHFSRDGNDVLARSIIAIIGPR